MPAKKKTTEEPEKKDDQEEETPKKKPSDDRVANLEKKMGEMSDTMSKQNEFIQGASTVINTLAYNPELRTKFQEVYGKQQGVVPKGEESSQQPPKGQASKDTSGQPQGQNEELTRKVDEVSLSRREEIVKGFEDEVGISKMKESERNDARKKLEGYFNRFGMGVKSNPLPTLRQNLDDAYLGTIGKDKLKEEGKLEGIAQFQNNRQGAMGTISGGTPDSSGSEGKMDEKQKGWAEKLGANPKKAEKTYLARDEEETRVSGGEKRAKK